MKPHLFTIPNAITCLNLLAGCVAIECAAAHDYTGVLATVALAAVFDFLDGLVARLLHSYSETGRQLDSLADAVSFGVAPAFALFNSLHMFVGWERWLVFVLAAFSALRLAKFNVDTRQSEGFIGLPTPACALLVVSLVYLAAEGQAAWLLDSPWILIGVAIVLSALLVSEVPMFSLKFRTWGWRGNEVRWIFLAASLILLVLFQICAIPMIIGGYIVFSLLAALVRR